MRKEQMESLNYSDERQSGPDFSLKDLPGEAAHRVRRGFNPLWEDSTCAPTPHDVSLRAGRDEAVSSAWFVPQAAVLACPFESCACGDNLGFRIGLAHTRNFTMKLHGLVP